MKFKFILLLYLLLFSGCAPKYIEPNAPDSELGVIYWTAPARVYLIDQHSVNSGSILAYTGLDFSGPDRFPRVSVGTHKISVTCYNQIANINYSNTAHFTINVKPGSAFEVAANAACGLSISELHSYERQKWGNK